MKYRAILWLLVVAPSFGEECLTFKDIKITKMTEGYLGAYTYNIKQLSGSKFTGNFSGTLLKTIPGATSIVAFGKLPGMLLPLKITRKLSEPKTKDEIFMPEILKCSNIDRSPNLEAGTYRGVNCVADASKIKDFAMMPIPKKAEGTAQLVDRNNKVLFEAKASYEFKGKCDKLITMSSKTDPIIKFTA